VKQLAKDIPESEIKVKHAAEAAYLFLKTDENFKSIQGLRSQLESIELSDFGSLICEGRPGIDIFDSYLSNKIVVIQLDSRSYGETAKTLGKLILQDLKATSARVDSTLRKSDRKPFSVIIDEFADLATEDFIAFLDRARSSKMSIVVAHQEICDLMRVSPEFAGRLMGNTSTIFAFLQKRPESAETIASIAGTRKAWKETIQSETLAFFDVPTGAKSHREVEEFVIHPNVIKTLRVGECVCIKKYPYARANVLQIRAESS